MSESAKPIATPIPAATILIVRDGPTGLEVFMVKRHHQIDFVAGALVFPGGKASKGDFDAGLGECSDGGEGLNAEMRALGAAAIREAFEESGILFAREAGCPVFITGERLAGLEHYRHPLEKGEITLLDMLKKERLRIAYDALAHFAHWITPDNMPKRFDTHFYVAAAPSGHAGRHDGRESVDSIWISPADAIADRKKWNVIFPTKLNLMKLAKSKTVADALAAADAGTPLTVTPWIEQGPNGPVLKIRDDAGYEQTTALLREEGP
ncbi:MAG: NUDIX hydrolase [Proteobacteria bacterium]|nr:NUDIX hydrolase [Pseudomonadota bacterium]